MNKNVEITRKLNSSTPGIIDPIVITAIDGTVIKEIKKYNRVIRFE